MIFLSSPITAIILTNCCSVQKKKREKISNVEILGFQVKSVSNSLYEGYLECYYNYTDSRFHPRFNVHFLKFTMILWFRVEI